MRKEVEFIFEETWLKKTERIWFEPQSPTGYHYQCPLSRLSDDGQTAYFTVRAVNSRKFTNAPSPPQDRCYLELGMLLTLNRAMSGVEWHARELQSVVRVGLGINDTYCCDSIMPAVTTHESTREISLNWKELYTNFFREEHLLSSLKAAKGIASPSIAPIDLSYPMVMGRQLKHTLSDPIALIKQSRDWPMLLAVHQRRTKSLSWPENHKASEESVVHLIKIRRCLRNNQTIAELNLQLAETRGEILFVEDPARNGWKRYTQRQRRRCRVEWYNHAHQERGATTLSKDLVVVEVERLARSWEKGMDWERLAVAGSGA
jgi:hypothetical protein